MGLPETIVEPAFESSRAGWNRQELLLLNDGDRSRKTLLAVAVEPARPGLDRR